MGFKAGHDYMHGTELFGRSGCMTLTVAFLQIFVIFLIVSIFQLNIKKPSCNQHVPSNISQRMSNTQATPKNMQSLYTGKYAFLLGMQGCRPEQNSNT